VILSLDTTAESGSIALSEQDRLVEEVALHSPDGYGHMLYVEIERLLKRHAVRVQDVDCFAAASGPGSFTGVRVGLTAVKGLAYATGKRVVPVSNLQALAWFGSAPLRATIIDARRGEIYGAVYDDRLEIAVPEVVIKFENWLKLLPSCNFEFISMDFSPLQSMMDPEIPAIKAPRALAGAIGHIAWSRLAAGVTSDPAEVDANYVRRSDAELFWKDPTSP
jgi:tRNA threonylcarbamoyladenosine biosynthesis protein TsaB